MHQHSLDRNVRDPEEILGDYLAADTPAQWLFGEISGYLFDGIDGEQRAERLEDFFTRLPEERAAYLSRQLLPEHLVQFTLTVNGRDGEVAQMSFAELPSPAVLLELCFKLADVGDQVSVRHLYASGVALHATTSWPAGMDWAERASAPLQHRVRRVRRRGLAAVGAAALAALAGAAAVARRRR